MTRLGSDISFCCRIRFIRRPYQGDIIYESLTLRNRINPGVARISGIFSGDGCVYQRALRGVRAGWAPLRISSRKWAAPRRIVASWGWGAGIAPPGIGGPGSLGHGSFGRCAMAPPSCGVAALPLSASGALAGQVAGCLIAGAFRDFREGDRRSPPRWNFWTMGLDSGSLGRESMYG